MLVLRKSSCLVWFLGQAGSQTDSRTSDSKFILKSLIGKRQIPENLFRKGKASKLYYCFVDFRKVLHTVHHAVHVM